MLNRTLAATLSALLLLVPLQPTIAQEVFVAPVSQAVSAGGTVTLELIGNFDAAPTIGGCYDFVFNPDALMVTEVVYGPDAGFPDFRLDPVIDNVNGRVSLGITDFNGIPAIGDFLMNTITAVSLAAPGNTSSVMPQDGFFDGEPCGFYSAITFLQQFVNYTGGTVSVTDGEQLPFLRFPIDDQCRGTECTAYTGLMSSVLDRSWTPLDLDNPAASFYLQDGVVKAFNKEIGQRIFGVNVLRRPDGSWPSPGYAKDANGSLFSITGSYAGSRVNACSDSDGMQLQSCFPRTSYLDYDGHSGYDYAYANKPIRAAASGRLFKAVTDSVNHGNCQQDGWGEYHTFYIDHDNGYTTWYLHASDLAGELANLPVDGQTFASVEAGDVVAYSGNFSSCFGVGFHLHFEVRRGLDQVVDPYHTTSHLWLTPDTNTVSVSSAARSAQPLAVKLTVIDSAGNRLGPNEDSGVDLEISGATYSEDSTTLTAVLPAGPEYTVLLTGEEAGMVDVTFSEAQQTVTINEVRFEGLATAAGSLAQANYRETSFDSITIEQDIDGDGVVDTEVTPSPSPVADAGNDVVLVSGATATLDGSLSFDPSASPLDYLWIQTAGPAVVLSAPNAITTEFQTDGSLNEATFAFSLTVTNADSIAATDFVTVRIGSDADADGIPSIVDNCSQTFNPNQRDSDTDGFGNICDADLNNDCTVNAADLGELKSVFFSSNADADFNSDGSVNSQDLGVMRQLFFAQPGPAAFPNICDAQ